MSTNFISFYFLDWVLTNQVLNQALLFLPLKLLLVHTFQVRRGVSRDAVRPHHAVPAAGQRGTRRHLSGGQDDQSHEAGSLH